MNSIFSIATGALRAFGIKQKSTATNIANINTGDYKPLDVNMQETQNGGVKAYVTRSGDACRVDIAKEMVDMLVTADSFKANTEPIKAEDEMFKSLIDIKV
ncbi:flagellar hook-associated protein FlgK [bacterium BMS3Bbin06]|nr:flagellar hook-associated protein FlgK [bacterium BMS3Abin08]GBE34697.1 flagellar hook-associated protein FlgK [bacterium BMS3Bbin06]HDY71841.1 hypothetical protein [Nitrospirota bacterium]